MMKNKIWIVLILCLAGWNISQAQVKLSAVAGGGISDLHHGLPFSDNSDLSDYLRPGPLMQLGASVSSTFRKEGMLSWEAQLLVRRSTLSSVPIDTTGCSFVCTSPFPRDYSNEFHWNFWSVNIPISLDFQVFGPIGWKIGGNANFQLSEFPEDNYKIGGDPGVKPNFEMLSWQGHTGFYANIGAKLRVEALAYSDLPPRLTYGDPLPGGEWVYPVHREMGLYLNVLYRLY